MPETCKWCGRELSFDYQVDKECPDCWAMRIHINADPMIALAMLEEVSKVLLKKEIETLKRSVTGSTTDPGQWLDMLLRDPPGASQTPGENK